MLLAKVTQGKYHNYTNIIVPLLTLLVLLASLMIMAR